MPVLQSRLSNHATTWNNNARHIILDSVEFDTAQVTANGVSIGGKQTFQCVTMKDFLAALSERLARNTSAWDNYKRMYLPDREVPASAKGDPLRAVVLYKHMQAMLSSETAVLAETGDSWFNCQKLRLPDGCLYQFQVLLQPSTFQALAAAFAGRAHSQQQAS